jgi:Nif-specific regulatory protein
MQPRLCVIEGPFKGVNYPLQAREFSIGQADVNDLSLKESLVSRQHCAIRSSDQGFEAVDLGSINGTFVNNVPIRRRMLKHGDLLAVGGSSFIFLEKEEPTPEVLVQLDEDEPISRSSLLLDHRDVAELQERPWSAAEDVNVRRGDGLEALLKISRLVSSVGRLSVLRVRLLEQILEIIPAERAIVVLEEGAGESFVTVYGRKKAVLEEPIPVSRTILDKVKQERTAVLSKHILQSEFGRSKSLYGAGVESVLCVPLQMGSSYYGAIYLETTERQGFDEEHLRLLTIISGILAPALQRCLHSEQLEAEAERLRADLDLRHNMVGESPQMRALYALISRVAATDSTVLIRGESGTGKELAARALHKNSPRADRPFVAINCAAISEALLESELFGHERGAFTGAIALKKGKLEIAHQGTLFLDEIGELAPSLQSKLLRVLQEKDFERVGGTKTLVVDMRLVAATNRDLEQALTDGSFREDLYYRLNVVTIETPPLREHLEDIPLLVQFFITKIGANCGRTGLGISEEALSILQRHTWPGNVRELQNVIERAIVLGSGKLVLPEDLPRELYRAENASHSPSGYHDSLKQKRKELILDAVVRANGKMTEAARMLDLQSTYLHRLVRQLDLRGEIQQRLSSR